MSYTLYIDESGDEGIEKQQISRGASPLFFFGACLVSQDNIDQAEMCVIETKEEVGRVQKGLHFKEMRNHSKKLRCCKNFANLPVTAFGLISDKSQLDREDYREELKKWPGGYYNKNTAYLMELIGRFCIEKGITVDRIVFEEKRHDYNRMKNYLCAVRDDKYGLRNNLRYNSGWHHNADDMKVFNFEAILQAKNNIDEPLLKICDALAYSLHSACIEDEFKNTINSYILEMKDLFYSGSDGLILNHGIKPVIDFRSIQMKDSDKSFLGGLRSSKSIYSSSTAVGF